MKFCFVGTKIGYCFRIWRAGVIALLTVGYQAFKAAITNPVESLKTE
jgi:hypothetical protein